MTKLESLYVYIFDIFKKDDAKQIIENLDQTLGKSLETSKDRFKMGSVIREKEIKNLWKIKNLKDSLNTIREVSKSKISTGDYIRINQVVQSIHLVAIRDENLPFFTIVMIIDINPTLLNQDALFGQLRLITFPIRSYFEEFGGLSKDLVSFIPSCPIFTFVGMTGTEKEIKNIQKTASRLLATKKILSQSVLPTLTEVGSIVKSRTVKKQLSYMEKSTILRTIIPLNSLHHDFLIMSISSLYENFISFTGHSEQADLGDILNSYVVTFGLDKTIQDEIDPDMVLNSLYPYSYGSSVFPHSASGSLIFFQSILLWITHLNKKGHDLNSQFNQMRETIKTFPEYDENKVENYLVNLNKTASSLAQLIADVGNLKRRIEPQINEFLRSQIYQPEIPILPSIKSIPLWTDYRESTNGEYMQLLSNKVFDMINQLKIELEQYSKEIDNFHTHLNNLVNLNTQKSMKLSGKVTTFATIAILILTGVLIYLDLSHAK